MELNVDRERVIPFCYVLETKLYAIFSLFCRQFYFLDLVIRMLLVLLLCILVCVFPRLFKYFLAF